MISAAIFVFYTIVCICEILYILFRKPLFRKIGFYIFPVAVILSLKQTYLDFTLINLAGLLSSVLVLAAYVYLKNKPFEKPDYRYLIILTATAIFSFFK